MILIKTSRLAMTSKKRKENKIVAKLAKKSFLEQVDIEANKNITCKIVAWFFSNQHKILLCLLTT